MKLKKKFEDDFKINSKFRKSIKCLIKGESWNWESKLA
jgi:hypothetical protein